MGLTDFFMEIDGGNMRHIDLVFDGEGMSIVCDEGKRLTAHEIHYLISIAYVHVGLELKGIIADPKDTAEIGFGLYKAFYQSYEELKGIRDMSLNEFNQYMRDHGM